MIKVIRGLHNIHTHEQGTWVSIGNFDGLHLGHRALIEKLADKAQAENTKTMLINFHPSPDVYFHPKQAKPKLMSLFQKIRFLDILRVDQLLLLWFNDKLAHMSAKDFIEKILIKKLKIKGIIVGEDFHFGYQRKGNVALLQDYAKQGYFQCELLKTKNNEGERISSTRIRQALAEANFALAKQLLGRHYSMVGRVAVGQMRGRLLGFPTANISLGPRIGPLLGVFAGWVILEDQSRWPAVANIGWRPTVGGTKMPLLEVHIIDFNQDIYRQRLTFVPIAKVREEQKFASLDALKAQLHQDEEKAKALLTETKVVLS